MRLIYEEVSEFTLLFTGSRSIFFVTGCANPSSLGLHSLALDCALLELIEITEVSQWVGTLGNTDT